MTDRIDEQVIEIGLVEQSALAGKPGWSETSRTMSRYSPEMYLSCGTGEIPLLAVDHLVGNHQTRSVLQHAFAAIIELELRRDRSGQLGQFMVEERHTSLKPPSHGHIVNHA